MNRARVRARLCRKKCRQSICNLIDQHGNVSPGGPRVDDPTVRELVCLNLASANHEVFTAVDDLQDPQMMVTRLPDIIVADVQMSNMDGFGVPALRSCAIHWMRTRLAAELRRNSSTKLRLNAGTQSASIH